MSIDGSAEGFFGRGKTMACFQVSGKVADDIEAFRIGVSAVLMGWSPVAKAWWGQGSEGVPK